MIRDVTPTHEATSVSTLKFAEKTFDTTIISNAPIQIPHSFFVKHVIGLLMPVFSLLFCYNIFMVNIPYSHYGIIRLTNKKRQDSYLLRPNDRNSDAYLSYPVAGKSRNVFQFLFRQGFSKIFVYSVKQTNRYCHH